jgi:glutamate/tyrosine decarboxylase-like PLP-dependent enzyme
MQTDTTPQEETFDPESWDRFRALAHRMLDDTLDGLATLRDGPPWRPLPDGVRRALDAPVPREGAGEEAAYEEFVRHVLPYSNGNRHPRFWGWVQGNGTPLGMMADMLAAAMNPHMAGFTQAPALVETQVICWLAELLGFPRDAGGVLVTGGTMANVLGLAVARHAKAGWDVRAEGLQGDRPPLTVYGSAEMHGWLGKGVELLGMGNRAFRRVPVDAEFRIDADALARAVAEDRAAGFRPVCVVGTAGTVNTGASDDLRALAEFCRREGLWFHVDGAFGALAYLSDALRPAVAGLEEADSVGFDLHKWGYLPFECACVLVRDPALHRAAFAMTASYLAGAERGVIADGIPFAERGVDLTRGFKALKVWMSLKAYGADKLARMIEQNVRQARYLAARGGGAPGAGAARPGAAQRGLLPLRARGRPGRRAGPRQRRGAAAPAGAGDRRPLQHRARRPLRHPRRQRQPPQPPGGLRRAGGGRGVARRRGAGGGAGGPSVTPFRALGSRSGCHATMPWSVCPENSCDHVFRINPVNPAMASVVSIHPATFCNHR